MTRDAALDNFRKTLSASRRVLGRFTGQFRPPISLAKSEKCLAQGFLETACAKIWRSQQNEHLGLNQRVVLAHRPKSAHCAVTAISRAGSPPQIIQRDDGMFQIGLADDAPGPFESRRFAESVATRAASTGGAS